MKALIRLACLALFLSLPIAAVSFIPSTYADDGGGDGGGDGGEGGGDAGDGGYDDIYADAPIQRLRLKRRSYAPGEIARLVRKRDEPNVIIIIEGAGRGYEEPILNLAAADPVAAAELLSSLARVAPRNRVRIFEVVSGAFDEAAGRFWAARKNGSPEQQEKTHDALVALTWIKDDPDLLRGQ